MLLSLRAAKLPKEKPRVQSSGFEQKLREGASGGQRDAEAKRDANSEAILLAQHISQDIDRATRTYPASKLVFHIFAKVSHTI